MAQFLSDPWFDELNERFHVSEPWPSGARACQVVIEVSDAPSHLPQALTLSISDVRVNVAPGGDPGADTVLQLNYLDAAALTSGQLDSPSALREGRVKVRGDVNVLVPLATWLHAALAD